MPLRQMSPALKADLQLAKNNSRRRDGLRQAEAISMDELDRAEFEVKAKDARLKSAEAKLAELTNGNSRRKDTSSTSIGGAIECTARSSQPRHQKELIACCIHWADCRAICG